MGKSTRLRLGDVEACLDLLGECRELWSDPAAWRQQLLQGMCRLTGQSVAHYAEMDPSSLGSGPVQFTGTADYEWRDDAARSHYLRYTADMSGSCTVPFPGIEKLFQELAATRRSLAFRQEVCSDSDWYRSQLLNEFRRPAFNDGYVMSFILSGATGRCSHLGIHQDPQDPAPNARTKSVLDLLHRRLAPLIDTVLAGERHRSRQGLAPRLCQTLDRLLAGDSEKQIAAKLGISLPTVHEYVGKVYRHFNANSRAELMAYFVGRQAQVR